MTTTDQIFDRLNEYEDELIQFMRDLIRIPGISCEEKEVVERIAVEMNSFDFDEVKTDKMGNVIGKIGEGSTTIAMDAHIDTVDTGSLDEWEWDPFEGKFEDGVIYGRGATDQLAGMASMVYAGRVINELDLRDDYTLYIVGSVQEEDCDGLPWQYILNETEMEPDCVIITEPTNLNIYRGQRGRMEIGLRASGISCHGSAPERGENAIYRIAKIVGEIEKLNERLRVDDFLGKGTVTVSYIDCETPSLCAVPDEAYIHLDRRLTAGETKESAVEEVRETIEKAGVDTDKVEVEILNYDTPSYTGFRYPTEKYYPVWVLPENHELCEKAIQTYRDVFSEQPQVDKWTFSTNGVATMGMFDVPTIGFGPANEVYAHTVNEQVAVDDLIKAAAWYAHFPQKYTKTID